MVAPGPGGVPPAPERLEQLPPTVAATSRDPEHLTFALTTATAGYLVVAAPAYPGWAARLDGQPVPVQTLDGVLPAIGVGPGSHQVAYTYEPTSVWLGAALSALGIVVCLTWQLIARVKGVDRLSSRDTVQ
jgi:uncharacterized membrane protein YfhO